MTTFACGDEYPVQVEGDCSELDNLHLSSLHNSHFDKYPLIIRNHLFSRYYFRITIYFLQQGHRVAPEMHSLDLEQLKYRVEHTMEFSYELDCQTIFWSSVLHQNPYKHLMRQQLYLLAEYA